MFVITICGSSDPVVGPFNAKAEAEGYLSDNGWKPGTWESERKRGAYIKEKADGANTYVADIVELTSPSVRLDFYRGGY